MTLKGLRAQAGMTIPEAALALGLSERHFYRLEEGVTPLRKAYARVLADLYGVSVDVVRDAAGKGAA